MLPASVGGGLVKVVAGRVTTTTNDQKAEVILPLIVVLSYLLQAGRRATIKPTAATPKKKSQATEAATENEVWRY